MMDRVIILIDMNSYFASVEQIANPALRNKPVIVCGQGRTVVTTASYEARKYGIKTGMTLPEAKRLCPDVINVCGNLDKYSDTSLRIHKILLEFTDQVEAFSIDECFMDITHLVKKGEKPKDIALRIKKMLKEDIGLICSIGIGPNKLIAKLASKMQKPDGLVEIKSEDVPKLFSNFPIEEFQGIGVGSKVSEKFRRLGINTAKELGDASIDLLTSHFGILGYFYKKAGRGEDDSVVKKYWENEQIKSVGHSYTFVKDAWNLDVVKSYLLMLSEKVGARLRAANMMGRTVSLMIRFSDFNTVSKQYSLKHYIKNGLDIYLTAFIILKKYLPLKKAVRLLGVSISNLSLDDKQKYFIDEINKKITLTECVDLINKKYGDFALKPASVLIAEKYGVLKSCGMTPKAKYILKKG